MLIIIGACLVVLAILGGYLMEGGNPFLLFQPAEFVIIFGAAIGGFLIGTPLKAVNTVIGAVMGAFRGDPYSRKDYLDTLMLLSEIFYKIRKRGLVAIEADVDRPEASAIFTKYPNILKDHEAITFITDTLRTVISTQIDPLELEALMDIEMEEFLKEQMIPSKSMAHIADSLPGLGIVAAVLGVVLTMGKIGESPEVIGHSVGAALVGTFLGVLMCYGFAGPLSRILEHIAEARAQYMGVLKISLKSFVSNNAAPQVAIEFGRRIIPVLIRPGFLEVEEAMRQVKK